LVAAPGDGAIRAAYLYSEDLATAQAFVDLLNASDFTATAIPIAEAEWPYTVFLPLVLRSQGGPAATEGSLGAAAVPDFSEYDLILIGPETAKGSVWSPEPGLVTALVDSGLPVVGLGNGGYAFFGELALDIGYPQGTRTTGRSVQVSDFGDSQPFYSEPNAIPIPGDQILDLYQTEQDAVAIPLSGHLAHGVRVASLVSTDSYPIVASGERYLLWGFHGSPSEMTTVGQQLFLNALRFRVQKLNVPLRSRSFIPEPGIEQALLDALNTASGDGLHAYVQLHEPPTPVERAALKSAEVTLLDFVHGTTYTAFVDKALDPNDNTLTSLVRWMGLIPPADKVDPKILAGNYETWADNGDGTVNLLVTFFSDVVTPTAESILATHVVSYSTYANHQWAVVMNKTEVVPLSEEDPVYWIEEGPIPLLPINDEAREDLMVDEVQQAVITGPSTPFYKGLDGSGVSVGIFDTGVNTPTFQHQDFAGRLLRTANDTNSHGSHVAGIVGASGSQSVANCPSGSCTDYELRGMAPNVSLAPYYGWNATRMDQAVNTYNIEVSNHSYVMTCGLYNTNARDVDRLVRGDLQNGSNSIPSHFAVWAAANQGTGAQYCTTGTLPDGTTPDPTTGPRGYYSILSPAKNQLTVGALNRNSNYDLRASSSRGPTWDGRLKPEVMGIGCEWSTDNDSNGYTYKCGTSMASPSVAGVTALVVQQYHQTYPSAGRPTPSLLKAILVQSADDLEHQPGQAGFTEYGWNDPDSGQPVIYHAGPDWATGYGVVNAERAVALVRGRNLIEGTVSPGDTTDTYTVEIPEGRTEFKVTLAWDDEAGNPTLAVNAAQLVNDLDLTLEAPDGTIYRPWVVPALPRATSTYNGSNQDTGVRDPITRTLHVLPAFRGVDRLNVVEQVGVTDPVEIMPGTWTIRVNAFNLPNGNAQPYSLAGDFRSINIIEPQTGNYAEAGDPANPNVILVAVEAENGLNGDASTLVDADLGDFEVTIDGSSASIINGAPVGDQFWLNVQPQSGLYSAGSKYDLTVSLEGYGSDTETRAVLFTEREITDRAVILDTSGSMADYDKMAAAQNAARLFIDQSLIGDRVAVVEFDTGASTPYAITEVSSSPSTPELSAAKSAVDALLVGGRTAIGQGLLEGQDEVTAAPADFSLVDVLVLLSDGMENEDPLYDTPAVKGVIEPTGTIIHTVAVGPSEAGHHTLLEEIADDNGGRSYHVTESSVVLAAAGDGVQIAATGEGLDAWPGALANRLGDTYKQIAEEVLHENRLYQYSDLSDPKAGTYTRTVNVPAGLKRVTFALNWEEPSNILSLRLRDPDGNLYEYDPQNNNFCRSDATHETCIIDAPTAGIWEMMVDFVETDRANEFVLWASARTAVNFQLFVGTPERERTTHNDIHLVGFLHESGVPLPEQAVQVRIFDPLGEPAATLTLLDDGKNGDGKAGDGIYGAYFLAGEEAGAYAVRGMAKGEDRNGEPFTLYKNTNFHLRPRALYIHTWDTTKGIAYRNLLEKNSFTVDLAYAHVVPTLDLSKYSLVIVGPETGYLDDWEPAATIRAITNNEIPVLGLGEGGYAYFGKRGLEIGHANGAHGSGTSINWARDTSSDDIWFYPYEINRPKEPMPLYTEASPRVDIYIGDQPTGVTTFGYNDNSSSYADLIMESGWYMLWGFDDGPAAMTDIGRQLFVNTAYRTKR
jgi:Mg-chelatase subunit ChlD/subtilisin family serine protease